MKNQKRKLISKADKRNPPDLKKLSRALIALAQAKAEADAMADHEKHSRNNKKC